MIRLLKLSFLIAVMLSCGLAHAQQSDDPIGKRERGIKLYEQGKDGEAVKVLQAFVKRYTMDTRAWHYLGLVLSRMGKTDDARKAHENAVRSAIELTREYLSNAKPNLQCVMVRPLSTTLTEAAESADMYLDLSKKPSASKVADWHALSEELRRYLKICDQSDKTVDLPDPDSVSTKARIISKPSPEYTEDAVNKSTSGTVILFMMFADDGTIKAIVPLVSLPNGLTRQAIKAARKIKFTPADLNGQPVSQYIRVEYNFYVY